MVSWYRPFSFCASHSLLSFSPVPPLSDLDLYCRPFDSLFRCHDPLPPSLNFLVSVCQLPASRPICLGLCLPTACLQTHLSRSLSTNCLPPDPSVSVSVHQLPASRPICLGLCPPTACLQTHLSRSLSTNCLPSDPFVSVSVCISTSLVFLSYCPSVSCNLFDVTSGMDNC